MLTTTLTLLGMLALRIGVPVLATAVLCFALTRVERVLRRAA